MATEGRCSCRRRQSEAPRVRALEVAAQRLASEFHHLKGGISCHGGWWRQFQPVLCANATERKAALVSEWEHRHDSVMKQIRHRMKTRHTCLAPLLGGLSGLTRAQTVQILCNTLALELVILCMLLDTGKPPPAVSSNLLLSAR